MKTYAIADLHGRADLLHKAYARLAFEEAGLIVHLGDYIDRGRQSRQVIDLLMEPATVPAGFHRIVLRGNHEDIMLQTIRKPLDPSWWIGNGGGKTLESYGHPRIKGEMRGYVWPYNPRVVPEEHLDFIAGLPRLHCDQHRIYVHACVDREKELCEQRDEVLLWSLYAKKDREGYRGLHVVHGHHFHEDGPLLYEGRTNLDVNAWSTGRLVIGVFDSDKPGGPIEVIEVN